MLASFPASMVNQNRSDLGILNRFNLTPSRSSARGVIKPEPLYTVAFEAADLWPEAQASQDRVFVDAWESYLEPA
jgi:hypothetical protein